MENLLQQVAIHFAIVGESENRCHILMKGSEEPNVKNGTRLFENKEMVLLEKMFATHVHDYNYSCEVDGKNVHFMASSYQSADKSKRWVVFERIHLKELEPICISKTEDLPQNSIFFVPDSPNASINFRDVSTNKEILSLRKNGDILLHGKHVTNDMQVVEGMREFLESMNNSHK